jgi:hypothetical protein
MRAVTITYTLRSGQRGRFQGLFASTSAGVLWALDHFGQQLRCCTARTGG